MRVGELQELEVRVRGGGLGWGGCVDGNGVVDPGAVMEARVMKIVAWVCVLFAGCGDGYVDWGRSVMRRASLRLVA